MLLMAQQQRSKLPEEMARVFRDRNLNTHSAHLRTGVDRQSIMRMQHGLSPRLDVIEKWARGIGEDVNHWRDAAGYPVVETPESRLLRGIKEIQEETGQAFEIDTDDLALDEATPQAVERLLARIRERVLARKQREEQ
jgi:hypothetical protein